MNRKDLDRLSRLRESANDSARNFRTVYVSYLVIALYILSIVIFREEEDLFRNGSLQIAIVNFSVPIGSFFIVSPLILLALHFNLLIQAIFLSRKVHQYASAIPTIHPLQLLPSSNDEKREMRDLLFPAPLAHMIAGGDSDRTGQNLLLVVVISSIIFLPPIILISTGIQFLAYQSKYITIEQSILVAIDVGILWWLWPRIAAPDKKWIQWFESLSPVIIVLMALLMTLLMTLLTILLTILISINLYDMREFPNRIKPAMSGLHVMSIAKQPSSLHDDSDRADPDDRKRISSFSTWVLNTIPIHINNTKYEFEDRELVQERPPPEILSAYLDTCREKRCDEAVIDPGTPVWCRYARPLDLEKRVFRNADLSGAILCAVDFESVILNNADLIEAKLHGANLIEAKLHGAVLDDAELHGAILDDAELHGADLRGAELHGANLLGAELHGANLLGAELHGANLLGAELHGANLLGAELHGANLLGAELHGANLRDADFRGADLREAKLYGANLTNADLGGADLRGAKFYGTELIGTNFDYADRRAIYPYEPDFSELYTQLRKTVNDIEIFKKIQDRIANAKNHETIDLLSRKHKYSIVDAHGPIPTLEESIGEKYREKLATYLVDVLACEDGSSGYIAKGIARRALADRLLGPQLAENLLKAKCPAVANMLPEQLRADLEKITGE